MNDSSTTRLLEQAKLGCPAAVGSLFQRERLRLRRTVEIRLDVRIRARIDPSDILQESFAEASRRLPEYLKVQAIPFSVWLRQVVEARMIDIYRRHIKSLRRSTVFELRPEQAALGIELLASTGLGADAHFAREEAREIVRRELCALPLADQEILVMRHVEQLRVLEIAAILELSEDAVKSRLRRALERLKQRLDQFGMGEPDR